MRSWNSEHNSVDITHKWSGVPRYLDYYAEAYKILTDEGTVMRALKKLAESATSVEGIKAELVRIEGQHKFSEIVPILPSLKNPFDFFRLLCSRQAFLDLGAGQDHGALTHRYQWAILADTLALS